MTGTGWNLVMGLLAQVIACYSLNLIALLEKPWMDYIQHQMFAMSVASVFNHQLSLFS